MSDDEKVLVDASQLVALNNAVAELAGTWAELAKRLAIARGSHAGFLVEELTNRLVHVAGKAIELSVTSDFPGAKDALTQIKKLGV